MTGSDGSDRPGLGLGAGLSAGLEGEGEGDAQHAGELGQGPLLGREPNFDRRQHGRLDLLVAHRGTMFISRRLGAVKPDARPRGRVLEAVHRGGADHGLRGGLIGGGAELPPAALAAVAGETAGRLGVGLLPERLTDAADQAATFDIETGHVVTPRSEHHEWVGHGTVSIGVRPSHAPTC